MQLPSWIPFARRQPQPAEPVKQPPKGEISLRDPLLFPGGIVQYPYNPDIFVQKKSMGVYDKMRRDDQVKACQWLKRLAVLCSGWSVEAASDDNVDTEPADFCKDSFQRIPGTFESKVKEILSGMDFGFSVTEKIWAYVEEGDFAGKIGLANLKTRKPHRWDFVTDAYGNLLPDGLWQMNGMYKYDPAKFVIYSHQKEFDNWYGRSDLQEAYKPWWYKDVIAKFWSIFLERFAMGIPVLQPKEGKTLEDPLYTTLKNQVFNIQGASAFAWNVDAVDLSILESKRKGAGEYDKAVAYLDRAIGRALLMPSGVGFSEDSREGSYARSKTHLDVWVWIMMDLRKTTEELINEQIIPDLVRPNYAVGKFPRFKFHPLEEDERKDLGELWLKAVEGKAVHPDAEDELHFRRLIKFPEREVEELEGEIKEAKANKPIPPGFPGGPPATGEEEVVVHSHARSWHRTLTKYEKRTDFARVEKQLDDLEDTTRSRLKEIMEKQRDKLAKTVEKSEGKITMNWINSLALSYGVEFQSVVREFMRTGFDMGRADAREEVAKARKKGAYQVVKMPPKATMQMLEKSAFWIKNVTFGTVTKEIQGLLLNALETAEGMAETIQKIRGVYEPYLGDPQVLRDAKQIQPYRIETLIRTNATKAYNRGKVVEYLDPALEGFVKAVQLSAILDTRTTDICREADGKIVMADDPNLVRMTPPLHHQCRTVAVPVTVVDGEFEPSRQAELEDVKSLMPKDFGGNIDR